MDNAEQVIHPRARSAIAADSGILKTFGMTVRSAQAGVCEALATVPDTLVNAGGFAHGSIAFSLMDTACAYALGSLEVRGVTVNANTSYVKRVEAGAQLTAKVSVLSRSRRVATLTGQVFVESDNGRELVAHGSFTFALLENES